MPSKMPLADCLQVLHSARTDEVVVSVMGAAREWMKFTPHPLDFVYVPSSMGQATAWGLGLALAQPQRKIVVCNGDGSLLMNLGSLISITAQAPPNLILLTFDNGVYEVTGAQPTPGAAPIRNAQRAIDYCDIARSCGFENPMAFESLDDWRRNVSQVLSAPGPTFAVLKVEPFPDAGGPRAPGPARERARKLAAALKPSTKDGD